MTTTGVENGEIGFSELIPAETLYFSDIEFPTNPTAASYISNIIQHCCIERTCFTNFFKLGESFLTAPEHPIVYSKDKYCNTCGKPNTSIQHQEILKDFIEDLFNLSDLRTYVDGQKNQVENTYSYCKIFKRFQKRIDNKCHRRNVFNGVVFIPQFNSFIVLHHTFRYTSRRWPVEKVVEQTVTEALFKVSNAIDSCPESFQHYTCIC